jgi:uncharacterized membrane protein
VKKQTKALLAFFACVVFVYWGMSEAGAGYPAFVFFTGFLLLSWLVWLFRRGRKARQRLENIEKRLDGLETNLRSRLTEIEAAIGRLQAPPASAPTAPAATLAAPSPTPTPATVSPAPAPPAPAPSQVVARGVVAEPPPVREAAPRSSYPPRLAKTFPGAAAGLSLGERLKKLLEIEEMLGTNWLSKLGISVLVLGIAFFLVWQLKELGPAGKVLVGYSVGLALLAVGIYFERTDRYHLPARAAIAGAWPLLFFVTYAIYHIPAARLQWVSMGADLVLMMLVAAAMVAHTLRYRSEVVTGLAFLLAFSTISLNRESGVYSLSAGLMLAAGVAVISVRMQWYEIEVFGILATYLSHFYWVSHIIEPMGGHHRPFPEFRASIAFLVLYWAVFRASYLLRQAPKDENVSTVAALLNTFLLLALARYQSVYPELAYRFLLVVGGVEFILGQLPFTRRRQKAFVILTCLGTVLLLAAFPTHYAPENVSIIWLAGLEALFIAGMVTREAVFRRLGMFTSVVVAIQLVSIQAARVMGERFDGATYRLHLSMALICGIAAVVFYVNAHLVPRRRPELFDTQIDRFAATVVSWLAALVGFAGVYVALPYVWCAVVWMVVSALLAWLGRRVDLRELTLQADALAALAFLRVLFVNFHTTQTYQVGHHDFGLRLLTVALVAAMLYLSSRWSEAAGLLRTRHMPGAFTWTASGLVTLLMWYELRTPSVALGWAAFGLVLFELGFRRQALQLRLQAYVALCFSFLRIFYVNLNAAGSTGELSPRVYTVLPLAVILYAVYEKLEESDADFLGFDRWIRAPRILPYLGTLSLAALLRFEAQLDWVAAAWSALVVALLALAWRTKRRVFLRQGVVLALGVLFRGALHNIYERSYFTPPLGYSRWICLGATVALLCASLPFAFRLRDTSPRDASRGRMVRLFRALFARPEQALFFIPVLLLALLLSAEMRRGMVTMAWGLEAVVVFLCALKVGERSYRLAGLALLLICVAKIALVDIWELSLRDRSISFIVLGASLLGVSVLYSRHREKIRQYL